MNYADLTEVLVGDVVFLGGDARGEVVADIDRGTYTARFREEEWSYLERGVLVASQEMGLIHFTSFDGEVGLVSRADPNLE